MKIHFQRFQRKKRIQLSKMEDINKQKKNGNTYNIRTKGR